MNIRRKMVKKTPPIVDNPTESEKKCLQLIEQIQSYHKENVGIEEIARRTGRDRRTVKKYLKGDPQKLCRHGRQGNSMLDSYRDFIINELNAKVHQAEIIRQLVERGYTGTKTNARTYIGKLCAEYGIIASKYTSGGNSLGTKRTGYLKSMDVEYITRKGVFNHLWMGIELTAWHKKYIFKKFPILFQLSACINEFRQIYECRSMPMLYLFINRHQNSPIKEIASFSNGLNKDIEAVENAVASELSNGFVEGTNSKLKMIKRTMYGRCSRLLLSAKLMYRGNR